MHGCRSGQLCASLKIFTAYVEANRLELRLHGIRYAVVRRKYMSCLALDMHGFWMQATFHAGCRLSHRARLPGPPFWHWHICSPSVSAGSAHFSEHGGRAQPWEVGFKPLDDVICTWNKTNGALCWACSCGACENSNSSPCIQLLLGSRHTGIRQHHLGML